MTNIVIDNVTEKTVRYHYIGQNEPLPIQKVGDGIVYFDEIYDAEGATIGHTIGMVTATHVAANGHLMTHYEEAIELPDGTLRSAGTIDRQDMLAGGWARFPAVGTGGKFLGLTGIREWGLILPVSTMTVNLRITLNG
ncbi:hypothetical protein [Kitasatospora sp. NPDC059673]|uniref:allene oxide cyclase barrel-like domain-containing protein n=1 Tax=Kitasatospora sp. NPDC059673 TaxID=3346901 RepID=UPI00368310C7